MKNNKIIRFAALTVFLSLLACVTSCELINKEEETVEKKSVQEKVSALPSGGTLIISEEDTFVGNSVIVISKPVTIKAADGAFDMKGANMKINASGVVLDGLSNIGCIIVAEGVNDGEFTMSDCDINAVVVYGGGPNSIHFYGVIAGNVDVKKDGVRIHLDKSKKNQNRHSEVIKIDVNKDCKIESDDEESLINRVFVAKEVTKVNLAGQTVVSTIVVNADDSNTPEVEVGSENVVITKGCINKGNFTNLVELVVKAIEGIINIPKVPELSEEDIENIKQNVSKLSASSKPGDIVYYNGKECMVIINKYLQSAGRAVALNTEKDTALRTAMLKEYSNITSFIELYQIEPERFTGAQKTNGNATMNVNFYYFDKQLNKIAKIYYAWTSNRVFNGNKESQVARFEKLTDAELKATSPESIAYRDYNSNLSKRVGVTTHYVTVKSETLEGYSVDLSKPARVSIQKDFVTVDCPENPEKSPFTLKKYFNDDGTLSYTDYILCQINTLGETINLRFYENDPNKFEFYIVGNGFDSTSNSVFSGSISFKTILPAESAEGETEDISQYEVPLSYSINISKNSKTVLSNSFYGEESLCVKKSGSNIIVKCPTPPGTKLAKYCQVTLKKNSEGIYVPDYEAYRTAYENDFVKLWQEKFWNNKEQLIAEDEANGTFESKLKAELEEKWETVYSEKYAGKSFWFENGTWDSVNEKWSAMEITKIDFAEDKTFTSKTMYYNLETDYKKVETASGTVNVNEVALAMGTYQLQTTRTYILTGSMCRYMNLFGNVYVYAYLGKYTSATDGVERIKSYIIYRDVDEGETYTHKYDEYDEETGSYVEQTVECEKL